jgi:hypothetical protein
MELGLRRSTMTDNNIPPVPPAGSNPPYGQTPQQAPQYGAPQYNAPQQAPQYGAPAYGQPGQQPQKWNVLAIITLVSSILGFAVISIVLGIISLNQIKKTGEQGKVLAIVGIVIGALATIGYIIAIIAFFAILGSASTGTFETY